jgi:uncharacterized protein involved in response to NO
MMSKLEDFLSYAFRPMFLASGVIAIVAVIAWILTLHGLMPAGMPGNALYWHGHEMIVGFALATVAGFVLTAVANWTGRKALSGWPLVWLVASWLAGRGAMLATSAMPVFVSAAIDMLFPILLCFFTAREIFAAGNKRNYKIVALVAILAGLNLVYHLGVADVLPGGDYIALYLLIHSVLLLVTVIAGRVIPNFTANWLRGQGVTTVPVVNPTVDGLAITSTIATALVAVFYPDRLVLGALAMVTALTHAVRVSQWQGLQTTRNPLLCILHVAYLWLPAGYAMMSLASLGWAFTPTAALHGLTMGGIGSMILAMMTRVPLGHTGRALHASRLTVVAYATLTISICIRVMSPWNAANYQGMIDLAAAGWCLAFAIFIWVYWPILTGPRVAQ